ncbi:atrial natriuretic peptide receptor 1-like [Ostrea edulis]|uniref:atrial natriuretic peptide receptor 1-like n=1 Tax=Ostrea edulis TaxID=37623 RepID=UPI0024AF13DC|nr:atrial natriuretic peptide receptor 1-like [Ostrea edulis]
MLTQFTIALMLSALVYSKKPKITIGAFIGDQSLPFGIHRSGPAIELGLEKLKDIAAGEFDVEVIRYITDFECYSEMTGLFATVVAEMYHRGNITAIMGPMFVILCKNIVLRELLLTAHSFGMTNGEYVFLYFFATNGFIHGEINWKMGDENDEIMRKVFQSLFLVGLFQSETKEYAEFKFELKRRSLEKYNFSYGVKEDVNPHAFAFYLAFILYGETVKNIIRDEKDFRDGGEVTKRLWNRTFDAVNGKIFVNAKGDLLVDMMILDLDPKSGEFVLKSMSDAVTLSDRPMDTRVASYKGSKVNLFEIKTKSFSTSRTLFLELLQLRDVNCANLAKFIGLTESDSDQMYAVTEFCSRGDLRDILTKESFNLNKEFRISLIRDIIKAMEYIHTSNILYHGHLSSRSCVIDSRFVLKVTDFGIQSLRDFEIDERNEKCLWAAPELLRKSVTKTDITGMQCADIYSFGIILYEVLSRKGPFEDDRDFLTLDEVITKLKYINQTPFRPRLDLVEIYTDIDRLMKMCWDEDPKLRPTFHAIRKESRKLQWDRSGDKLLDTLLSRMEEYADNLEGLVEERTQNLIEEKRKSEELLYQVLPRSVVNKLRSGRVVEPEAYTCVTIYFSDIVGFTDISSDSTPMQIVDLLNDLYTSFDKIIDNFDVYKVETIGDAYMVVSGLPVRNGDQHVVEIAKMSCSILQEVNVFKIRHKPNTRLSTRIGIHSGSVCAGVVGRKMPRYCLFGDTVNTASRMESNGQAMKIHCSDSTRDLLVGHHEFVLEDRGNIQVKGKGVMKTYWLRYHIEDASDNVMNV